MQRFFELITNKSQPSVFTLNILSEYIGYSSFEDLKNKNKEDLPISNNEKLITDEFGITLFNLCLKNHHFDTVLQYIYLLPSDTYIKETHTQVSQSLGLTIRKDKKARNILLPELAKTKNGRTYFYEGFVDIDFVNQYFKQAIISNYNPHIGNLAIEKNKTDFVFSKAIEFVANVKANKKKQAIWTSYTLFQKVNIHTDWQELSHPYPYARLISVYLISEYLKDKLTIDKITLSIEKIENVLIANGNPLFVLAQLIMALNYCKCYSEVITFYNKYKKSIDLSTPQYDYNYTSIINCVNRSKEHLNIFFEDRETNKYIFEQRALSISEKTPLF